MRKRMAEVARRQAERAMDRPTEMRKVLEAAPQRDRVDRPAALQRIGEIATYPLKPSRLDPAGDLQFFVAEELVEIAKRYPLRRRDCARTEIRIVEPDENERLDPLDLGNAAGGRRRRRSDQTRTRRVPVGL